MRSLWVGELEVAHGVGVRRESTRLARLATRRDRILSISPRLVLGSPTELERALERSEDSNKPNAG